MTNTQPDAQKSLLLIAILIVGGILFAGGVMVGRASVPEKDCVEPDHLKRIDQRDVLDEQRAGEQNLIYPKTLSEPKAKETAPKTKILKIKKDPPVVPDALSKHDDKPVSGSVRENPEAFNYTLQIASFRELEQAEKQVSQLKQSGVNRARIESSEVEGKGLYYRVRVGKFKDKPTAESYKASKNLDGLIVKVQ
jgi:cell division protein FtsN